jgi:hypothetical protein
MREIGGKQISCKLVELHQTLYCMLLFFCRQAEYIFQLLKIDKISQVPLGGEK